MLNYTLITYHICECLPPTEIDLFFRTRTSGVGEGNSLQQQKSQMVISDVVLFV